MLPSLSFFPKLKTSQLLGLAEEEEEDEEQEGIKYWSTQKVSALIHFWLKHSTSVMFSSSCSKIALLIFSFGEFSHKC